MRPEPPFHDQPDRFIADHNSFQEITSSDATDGGSKLSVEWEADFWDVGLLDL